MDISPQRLELFLMLDAEMLFLIDDDKAQIFEGNLRRQDRVGANKDLHLTGCQSRAGLGSFLGWDHA